MAEQPTYVLERTFDAPRQMVWNAWIDPDVMQRSQMHDLKQKHHTVDIRPGGRWLLEVEQDEPTPNYHHRFDFTEVLEPERLICLSSHTDADWNPATPRIPGFPKFLVQTVTLEEREGRTVFRLTQVPHDASSSETACFAAYASKPQAGFEMCMEKLTEILEEKQA